MQNILLVTRLNTATWKKVQLQLLHLKAALFNKFTHHPLKPEQVFLSPGGTSKYKVVRKTKGLLISTAAESAAVPVVAKALSSSVQVKVFN